MLPIAPERCVGGSDLTEPRLSVDGSAIVYAESIAGEARLVVHHFDGSPDHSLATSPPLRPGRAFCGGAWTFVPDGSGVVYVGTDGNLWRQDVRGGPSLLLTEHGPERAASNPMLTPDGTSLVYVLEQAEIRRLHLPTGTVTRVDAGSADFCMDPFVEADSVSVRWHAWDVPDMPWDRSRVQRVGADGIVHDVVAPGCCVQQPRVLPDGSAICVRDDNGWLNVWVGDTPLVDEPFEHAGPSWGPGQQSYVWSPDGTRVAFTRNERGFGRLCVVDLASGAVQEVARGVHGHLSWQGGRLAAVRSGARTPTQVVVYDTATWERTIIAIGPSSEWSAADLAEPELVEVAVEDGVLHARLYRAENSDGRMIVWLHGGPTDQWQVTFMPRITFWMSRGWNVLVPDHRGSTGHGREYQQALRGRWGELDVADVLAFTTYAHEQGWAQRARTVVIGSSAGGFTALSAVAAEPGRFAAAVLLYPVTDLMDLADRSHRFERHYTITLVGPLPQSAALYRERSPVFHADRCVLTPLLLLHGDVDAVVPVQQSRVFAQRVRTSGGDVELHVYEGEGHGFRQTANQLDEYRRVVDFLARCVPVASPS